VSHCPAPALIVLLHCADYSVKYCVTCGTLNLNGVSIPPLCFGTLIRCTYLTKRFDYYSYDKVHDISIHTISHMVYFVNCSVDFSGKKVDKSIDDMFNYWN